METSTILHVTSENLRNVSWVRLCLLCVFSKPYSFFGSRLNGRVTVAYFQREHLYAEIIRDGTDEFDESTEDLGSNSSNNLGWKLGSNVLG